MEKMTSNNCSCPMATTTTYHEQYQQFEKTKPIKIHPKPMALDQELISGHMGNYLRHSGLPRNSKVWPEMLTEAEEYKDFLGRLEKCRNDIFQLYFKSPPVDQQIIENMFKSQTKSVYASIFSPNEFMPLKESLRAKKLGCGDIKIEYHETTYNTFYGRLKELEQFRDLLYATIVNRERLDLKQELRHIYKCGHSTYNETISKPAAIYARHTLPGPIDRYTMRRI
ncbi:uncharacterized protein [Musca autumnalis]|uniref:uncharacterized protein n=1 Tax=Musca autumnalis TaxID=221902 RepID=UPI003CF8CBA6